VTRWAAFSELRRGVGIAVRQPRLIAALWLWQLVVALAGTLPVFQWLRDTTALRPAADRLLVRFSLPDVVDAVRTTQGSPVAMWNAALSGSLLLTVVTAPVVIAATLDALRDAGGEPVNARTVSNCYWRLLRLTVFGRGTAIVAAILTAAGLALALRPLHDRSSSGVLLALSLAGAVAACIGAWLWAAVDVGAVAIVHGRVRGAFAGWVAGLRTVLRVPAFTLLLWASFAVALIGALLLLAAGIASLPATTLPLILLMAALHQAFAVWRVVLRVGVLSAEAGAWMCLWPSPLPTSVETTPAEPPPSVHHEEHPRPGQDGEREIDDREAGE